MQLFKDLMLKIHQKYQMIKSGWLIYLLEFNGKNL